LPNRYAKIATKSNNTKAVGTDFENFAKKIKKFFKTLDTHQKRWYYINIPNREEERH